MAQQGIVDWVRGDLAAREQEANAQEDAENEELEDKHKPENMCSDQDDIFKGACQVSCEKWCNRWTCKRPMCQGCGGERSPCWDPPPAPVKPPPTPPSPPPSPPSPPPSPIPPPIPPPSPAPPLPGPPPSPPPSPPDANDLRLWGGAGWELLRPASPSPPPPARPASPLRLSPLAPPPSPPGVVETSGAVGGAILGLLGAGFILSRCARRLAADPAVSSIRARVANVPTPSATNGSAVDDADDDGEGGGADEEKKSLVLGAQPDPVQRNGPLHPAAKLLQQLEHEHEAQQDEGGTSVIAV